MERAKILKEIDELDEHRRLQRVSEPYYRDRMKDLNKRLQELARRL